MKLITMWSPKGGVGRTTLAMLLASSLKNKGYSVCVYDDTDAEFSLRFAEMGKTDIKVAKVGQKFEESEMPDFLILDTNAMTFDKAQKIESSSVVVSPVQPSYPDVLFLNEQARKIRDKSKLVFCFNKALTKRKEHVDIFSDENFAKWPVIKDRAIYERLNVEGYDLFNSKVDSWATVNVAREEVNLLAQRVLSKMK